MAEALSRLIPNADSCVISVIRHRQLREAFSWDQAPRYLLRDRDAIYGSEFAAITKGMGVKEVVTAPRAPWQNPFVERLVGSIRRECLDHIIVWNERSLRRTLQSYFAYYNYAP
jgi:putative transposase